MIADAFIVKFLGRFLKLLWYLRSAVYGWMFPIDCVQNKMSTLINAGKLWLLKINQWYWFWLPYNNSIAEWLAHVFLQSHDDSEGLTAIVVANQGVSCFLQLLEDEIKFLPIGVWEYNGEMFEGQIQSVDASTLLYSYGSTQWFWSTIGSLS